MPLIQIPLEPPPTQPPRRNPNQGDLFDTGSWESAYRELHDFPTLLIQTRDELARARKREAFWISLLAHVVLALIIINSPKFEKYLPHRAVMLVHSARDNDKLTFLETTPDLQKPTTPPKTNVMSDKNRIAQTKAPKLDQKELKKILDASRQGRPGPVAPPTPQQQAAAPPQAAQAQPQPQEQQPPPPANQIAKLQTPPMERKPAASVFKTAPMSASRSINEAARAAATDRRYSTGDNGDFGLGQKQLAAKGDLEITSETLGVDFGPYLQRVLHDVKQNWYAVIPESAMPPLLKKGKLSIEFAITKDGQIAGLRYVTSSGDVALDRAAYGGITASNPFPPLPPEFIAAAKRESRDAYLGLKFTFLYNPDPNEAADLH